MRQYIRMTAHSPGIVRCRFTLRRAAAVEAPSAPPSAVPTASGHCTPEDLRAHLIKKGELLPLHS